MVQVRVSIGKGFTGLRLLHVWLFKREAKDRMIVKVDDAGIMPAEDLEKVKQVPFPSCIFSLLAFLVLLLD